MPSYLLMPHAPCPIYIPCPGARMPRTCRSKLTSQTQVQGDADEAKCYFGIWVGCTKWLKYPFVNLSKVYVNLMRTCNISNYEEAYSLFALIEAQAQSTWSSEKVSKFTWEHKPWSKYLYGKSERASIRVWECLNIRPVNSSGSSMYNNYNYNNNNNNSNKNYKYKKT